MKKSLVVFILFPILLSGQVNESDSLKFKANLSLTGFLQGGNVKTIIFRAKSELGFIPWKNWAFKTKNSYIYQEFGREKADEDILSLNFLYINPERRFYPLFLGFISTNFRREIDLRTLFGAGVTYQILKAEKNWLKVSLTTEYEQTEFNSSNFNISNYDGTNNINTVRGTLWVNGKYHLFKGKVIISHESYYQPSLEDSDNYRWQADLGIELPVFKYLNFKVNYIRTFENIVIENQDQNDSFLTFGFTIKSYE